MCTQTRINKSVQFIRLPPVASRKHSNHKLTSCSAFWEMQLNVTNVINSCVLRDQGRKTAFLITLESFVSHKFTTLQSPRIWKLFLINLRDQSRKFLTFSQFFLDVFDVKKHTYEAKLLPQIDPQWARSAKKNLLALISSSPAALDARDELQRVNADLLRSSTMLFWSQQLWLDLCSKNSKRKAWDGRFVFSAAKEFLRGPAYKILHTDLFFYIPICSGSFFFYLYIFFYPFIVLSLASPVTVNISYDVFFKKKIILQSFSL